MILKWHLKHYNKVSVNKKTYFCKVFGNLSEISCFFYFLMNSMREAHILCDEE